MCNCFSRKQGFIQENIRNHLPYIEHTYKYNCKIAIKPFWVRHKQYFIFEVLHLVNDSSLHVGILQYMFNSKLGYKAR